LRVISGIAKGRNLLVPKNNVRPTTDKTKEFIFNCLNDVSGFEVLDIFAGSGNLGIEAISRGANFVTFVEIAFASVEVIKKNLALAKFTNKAKVLKLDFLKGLSLISENKNTFDLIFADPPYENGFESVLLEKIDTSNLLSNDGILVLEHSNTNFQTNLEVLKTKRFGETNVTFFRKKNCH
jgi:16S rRNA (guanine(966)-N(2))-methyltransferase RsmD